MAAPEFEEWYNLTDDFNPWDYIPGVELLEPEERDLAFEYFYEGFINRAQSPDEREAARDIFFDYLGLAEENFPWEDWREFMGY
jgi:hypothetical protein